jgi:hypothetical protein
MRLYYEIFWALSVNDHLNQACIYRGHVHQHHYLGDDHEIRAQILMLQACVRHTVLGGHVFVCFNCNILTITFTTTGALP